jgi:Aspartyl/Asparaginyl beta-hydroxylase
MHLLGFRFSVEELAGQLAAHPGVWNQYRLRTENPQSPHREVDDVWCRYNAIANLDPSNPPAFNGPHKSEWYPVVQKLPALPRLCRRLMVQVGAKTLGGVLITRVPAGKQVYWHKDGGWHAEAHRKWVISVAANREQTFEFENEQMRTEEGEAFEFDNLFPHRVLNPSAEDRVSVIVSLRDFQ